MTQPVQIQPVNSEPVNSEPVNSEPVNSEPVNSEPVNSEPVNSEPRGGCGCGAHDASVPVLDVRAIPQAVRHGAVLGAFDAIPPGGSMILVAPHAPLPMLAQLAERAPIDVETVVDGPTEWHIRVTRRAG